MKSEPTEKPRRKKTVVSETADRKNSRSLEPGHDEWWERLMMEPGPGEIGRASCRERVFRAV